MQIKPRGRRKMLFFRFRIRHQQVLHTGTGITPVLRFFGMLRFGFFICYIIVEKRMKEEPYPGLLRKDQQQKYGCTA